MPHIYARPHPVVWLVPPLFVVLALVVLLMPAHVIQAAGNGSLGGLTFRYTAYPLGPWPDPRGPYWPGNMNLKTCARDITGVCVAVINGITYNHPVEQAQDGLVALAQYRNDPTAIGKLSLAEKEAARLLSYKATYRSTDSPQVAWWFPYEFAFNEYPAPGNLATPPWFSAMAQGETLNLFTQLYEITADPAWQIAAQHTFDSFLYPRLPSQADRAHPWAWDVDSAEYLWLQEYPIPNEYNDTINGDGFATYSLIEYARTFGDAQATLLARAGMLTFLHGAGIARNPGGIASYSLLHRNDRQAHYHLVVTKELRVFAAVTGASAFTTLANAYFADYH